FKMARRRNKTTVLMGCGLGPLNTQKYQLCAKELIELSDKVIWRDEASAQMCNTMVERSDIYVLDDPAIISAQQYLKEKVKQKENYVAINFREFPNEYGQNKSLTIEEIRILLRKIAENHEVRLIPMHTFFIGGDDRDFFAEICDESIHEKVVVQYKPQNLHELYETYLNAQACIGMRYHSVVLQTILNGNNYIIDYTNPQNGKISGFLQYHMLEEKYEKKYFNLQNTQKWDLEECLAQLERGDCVEFPQIDSMERYCEIIKM
ncbi:polysaccharide pyruvyl transferase family protein, partial [Anaerosporobacter sp.]|uniref:polysaccharide pyruvyl transferase family protein n=1 Tax=Anaerosporobacter sp. TaxID=1872529 RepID=UPI00286EDEFA